MSTTKQDERLIEVGNCAMDSIRCMVAALNCDYERLEELRDTEDRDADQAAELLQLTEDAGDCTDHEDAQNRIMEDPLSLEFRSGWETDKTALEAREFCLLLTTGGPAVRIIGEIENGSPSNPQLQVQDWGTPWTDHLVNSADEATLQTYCEQFCFE